MIHDTKLLRRAGEIAIISNGKQKHSLASDDVAVDVGAAATIPYAIQIYAIIALHTIVADTFTWVYETNTHSHTRTRAFDACICDEIVNLFVARAHARARIHTSRDTVAFAQCVFLPNICFIAPAFELKPL